MSGNISINYALDSYASFQNEHDFLKAEMKKKENQKKLKEQEQQEILDRFKCIRGCFLRFSWKHKKEFVLSMARSFDCLDTLLQIINYISTSFGKMSAYIDVSPHCKVASQQIVIDHDRSLNAACLKETACDDLQWLGTVPVQERMVMLMELLNMAGEPLLRKVYIPIVNIYNKKIMEHQRLMRSDQTPELDFDSIFDNAEPDDSDKYPRDHPLTIEVEKLRKKWDEMIDKYRKDVFAIEKQEEEKLNETKSKTIKNKLKKSEKGDKTLKGKNVHGNHISGSVDWIQMLPIWIVKKILNYFDQKSLQNLKKVNSYWTYACDSLIKDRQARDFLNTTITDMVAKVDPQLLKEFGEQENLSYAVKKPGSPREKRIKKLNNRGAILESMRPKTKRYADVRSCLMNFLPLDQHTRYPFDKIMIFPRLIRDDLLLYKKYPCALKDVNILIDVDRFLKKQRGTMSYTLSQQLSDTFSMSGANLADW